MFVIGVLSLVLVQEPAPARPDDETLRAAVVAQRPAARVLMLNFGDSARGNARIGCGMLDVAGVIEPVSVVAAWKPRSQTVVTVVGVPPLPPEDARWDIRIHSPTGGDHDQDGEIGRYDRNADARARMWVKLFCPDLAPPEGVTWATEAEPHPDPERAARARQRARAVTDLIFGPQSRQSSPDRQ